jgi:hypothetical protein
MSYSIADLIIEGMAFLMMINANNWNEDGISETATQDNNHRQEAPL